MIVPFLYNLNNYSICKPTLLWAFYKLADFAIKNNLPMIGQEELFLPVSHYIEMNHGATTSCDRMDYKLPTDEEIANIDKYSISSEFDKAIRSKYKTEKDAWIDILKNRNIDLENEIIKGIDYIQKLREEKIDCMICWVSFPSLVHVCKKKRIKLINYEMSSIRKNNYNTNLGYFSFDTKYSTKQIKKYYNHFKSNKVFSRKELLTLLLNTDQLHYVDELNSEELYEFGIACSPKDDAFEIAHDCPKMEEVSEKLITKYAPETISYRPHPEEVVDLSGFGFNLDDSKSSIDWLLKCRRLISTVSNVGYESFLYGKTSYVVTNDIPFACKSFNNVENLEYDILDIKYLNCITFGFFTPFELMFDVDYIKWRLTNPNINLIYEKNLETILNKYNMDLEIFDLSGEDRLNCIMNHVHNK